MIIQGDALTKMSQLPDQSIDLIIADPPYGITNNHWDVVIDWSIWWREVFRVIKPNAAIILFSSGMHTAKLMLSNPKQWRYNLVWHKNVATGHLNAKKMPMRAHEDICVFYNLPPTYNPQKSQGHPPQNNRHAGSGGTGYRKTLDKSVCNTFGSTERFPTSVLDFSVVPPCKKKHHSEKPLEILEWLIKTYSKEGDTILDTFAGSGSTGQACINTQRSFVLIEKDKTIFEQLSKNNALNDNALNNSETNLK